MRGRRLLSLREGVIRRFRTGSQWRQIPEEFGSRQTVYDRFTQRRDAGLFAALMEGMIAEAASTPVWFRDLVRYPAENGYGHRVIIGWCVDKRRSCGGRWP
ncbi:transposase [Streptomyces lydicus]|uniref:transposase n=1 Tax=Streptomyces lydicus TaxID=47763 RepID=UPI0037AE6B2B